MVQALGLVYTSDLSVLHSYITPAHLEPGSYGRPRNLIAQPYEVLKFILV